MLSEPNFRVRHTSETLAGFVVRDNKYSSNQVLISVTLPLVSSQKPISLPEGLGVVEERRNSQELLDVVHYRGGVVSQLLTIHNEKLQRQQPPQAGNATRERRGARAAPGRSVCQ